MALAQLLRQNKISQFRLDGDPIRKGLSSDLGFSAADRAENGRRTAEVAFLFAQSGGVSLVALISPYASDRAWARERHENGDIAFYEVFVDAPLAVLEARDTKGFYRLARAGKMPNFTGVDAPYERPENPDFHFDTTKVSASEAACTIAKRLTSQLSTRSFI